MYIKKHSNTTQEHKIKIHPQLNNVQEIFGALIPKWVAFIKPQVSQIFVEEEVKRLLRGRDGNDFKEMISSRYNRQMFIWTQGLWQHA